MRFEDAPRGPLAAASANAAAREFYHYFGWEEHEAKAFLEFIVSEKLEIEYLARTPTCQVSLRVVGRGLAPRSSVRRCTWSPTGAGVGIRDPNEREAEDAP
jgi:hypothetical protein